MKNIFAILLLAFHPCLAGELVSIQVAGKGLHVASSAGSHIVAPGESITLSHLSLELGLRGTLKLIAAAETPLRLFNARGVIEKSGWLWADDSGVLCHGVQWKGSSPLVAGRLPGFGAAGTARVAAFYGCYVPVPGDIITILRPDGTTSRHEVDSTHCMEDAARRRTSIFEMPLSQLPGAAGVPDGYAYVSRHAEPHCLVFGLPRQNGRKKLPEGGAWMSSILREAGTGRHSIVKRGRSQAEVPAQARDTFFLIPGDIVLLQ